MVRVTALFVLGVVLMGLGVAYFIMGWVYDVLGLVIYSVLPFIVGFMTVLSELIINRNRNNKDRGGGDDVET
jgi:ABC-type proline/glycine betaine transport system permease subunit